MIEFLAVLGRMVVEDGFHQAVHGKSIPGARHLSEVKDLHEMLLNERYRLSRLEVGEVNRVVSTQRGINAILPITLPGDDSILLNLRSGWPSGDFPSLAGLNELASAVGLCCMDTQFKVAVIQAAALGGTDLETFLVTGTSTTMPKFDLTSTEVAAISTWIQNAVVQAALVDFEAARWEQPKSATLSCSPSCTFKEYAFVNEAKLGLKVQIDASFAAAFTAALQ